MDEGASFETVLLRLPRAPAYCLLPPSLPAYSMPELFHDNLTGGLLMPTTLKRDNLRAFATRTPARNSRDC